MVNKPQKVVPRPYKPGSVDARQGGLMGFVKVGESMAIAEHPDDGKEENAIEDNGKIAIEAMNPLDEDDAESDHEEAKDHLGRPMRDKPPPPAGKRPVGKLGQRYSAIQGSIDPKALRPGGANPPPPRRKAATKLF